LFAEYPEMSATNKGELKFLTRQVVTERAYRPLEEIVNGSIHTPNVREERGWLWRMGGWHQRLVFRHYHKFGGFL